MAEEWRAVVAALHHSAYDAVHLLVESSFDGVLLALAAVHEGVKLGDEAAVQAAMTVSAAFIHKMHPFLTLNHNPACQAGR